MESRFRPDRIFTAARPACAGFNLFADAVIIPHAFGQGKASGRTDNFERAANFGGQFRIRHKPRTVDLAQSSGFPIKMEGSMILSDWPSGGALPVINDGAANMACGWAGAFLPVSV